MKLMFVAAVAAVVACAPVRDLPDFTPAPEGMTKAYTPYDIPMAVPNLYRARVEHRRACPNKRFEYFDPYLVACEWGYALDGEKSSDSQIHAITLFALPNDVAADINKLSDNLVEQSGANTNRHSNAVSNVGELVFHQDDIYPYYSRVATVEVTDNQLKMAKTIHVEQYLAPVTPTDTHGLVVHVLRRTEVAAGTEFVRAPAYHPIGTPDYGTVRDVLFSVLDEMDHIKNPELFIQPASGT